jgi:putative endonuclease
MRMRKYYVYIMANEAKVIYIGVTGDLAKRVWEHKSKTIPGFTKRYGLDKLVYYEEFDLPDAAIDRETRLKKWHRGWKIELIESINPKWNDLSVELWGEDFSRVFA